MPIQRPRILHAAQMAGTGVVSPSNLNARAQSGSANRNLVHNGAMLVNQKGSSAITLSGLTPNIDRFTAYKANDGTQTVEQSTDGPEGFKNSLKVTNTGADASVAAGNRVAIIHRMEGQHVSHLEWGTAAAKTVTLSFYVKSSITGTHGGAFGNGANNRAYPFTYTISSANTWERKSITVAGDTTGTWATDNTTGLQVAWGLGVGTTNSGTAGAWESADRNSATGATTAFLTTVNATWFLTGVQLEIGDTATAFEHEPFERTLLKCQRYYYLKGKGAATYLGNGGYTASSEVDCVVNFPTTMRSAPSLEQVSGTNYYSAISADGTDTLDDFVIHQSTIHSILIYNNSDASGTTGRYAALNIVNAAGSIAFSSEL